MKRRDRLSWLAIFTKGIFLCPQICATALTKTRPQLILPLWICIALSIISFLFYGYDKYMAVSSGWRIRENLLHLLDVLGGWPGGLLAQYSFKHKTRNGKFQVLFFGSMLLHQSLWLSWYYYTYYDPTKK